MSLDKRLILDALLASLESDLKSLEAAAREAHEAATHDEGKAEDQYDTRGLEASYLAGAQAKRAGEIQKLIHLYRNLDLRNFSPTDHIAVTALVELESQGKKTLVFLVPTAGGNSLSIEGKTVQILSATSPLGEELIGRSLSKPSEVEFGVELSATQTREYRILALC